MLDPHKPGQTATATNDSIVCETDMTNCFLFPEACCSTVDPEFTREKNTVTLTTNSSYSIYYII